MALKERHTRKVTIAENFVRFVRPLGQVRLAAGEAEDFYQIYPTRARVRPEAPPAPVGGLSSPTLFALLIVPPSAGPLGVPEYSDPAPPH